MFTLSTQIPHSNQNRTTALNINSSVAQLKLVQFCVSTHTASRDIANIFQEQSHIPGVIVLEDQKLWSMISRNRFWAHMSRPYSLALFLDRPIHHLAQAMSTEVMCLPHTTPIVKAAQLSLSRSADLLDEPILVHSEEHGYLLLDAHQLLVAASQIHQLTAQLLKESSNQLKLANTELERLATADGLTGIANRRRFNEYLELAIANCQRSQEPMALILADVDFFKRYNDACGHLEGDRCLQAIAQCLQHPFSLEVEHLVARYGGEEFGIILPCHHQPEAQHILEQLRQAVAQCNFPHPDSPLSPHVTLSLGCVVEVPDPTTSAATFIQKADRALYAAKAQGRDRYIIEDGAEQS